MVGDGLKYGDNGALAVSSTFTATVPELTVADANVVADTHATFVSIAGQEINELDAKTTYKQKQLDFDATAKQPQRSLGVGRRARCCIRIIRKCTCRTLGAADAGADLAAGVRDRQRRSTTRTTRSRSRT